MKPQDENGGLKNKRRTEEPSRDLRRHGTDEQQSDMRFWLQLTPAVRATYMSMAYNSVKHPSEILRNAVKLARQAEMPSVHDF